MEILPLYLKLMCQNLGGRIWVWSGNLFVPNLLAAFEKAAMVVKAQEAERKAKIEEKIFKPPEFKKKIKKNK